MRLGICVSLDDIPAAAEAGFDYAEMSSGPLFPAQDEASFGEFLRRVRAAPLPVEAFNCFLPGEIRVTGQKADFKALADHARVVLKRARSCGASVMVFGSGGCRRLGEDDAPEKAWDQLAEAARVTAGIAADNGMLIAMEPLAPPSCNFFTRVDQGIAFVDRVNHPRLKLLADLYHVQKAGEPVANVGLAGGRFGHIHLATPSVAGLPQAPLPFDFDGFFRALRKTGYDGRVSVEDNPGLLRDQPRPLTPVFKAILQYLKQQVRK